MTADLSAFLLARVAEDEAAARAASPGGWSYGDVDSVAGGTLYDETVTIASLFYEQYEDHDGTIRRHVLSDEADSNGVHIARHDPARVLAQCAAIREVVARASDADALYDHARETVKAHDPDDWTKGAEWGLDFTLRALAKPYADHPDYRPEEWA